MVYGQVTYLGCQLQQAYYESDCIGHFAICQDEEHKLVKCSAIRNNIRQIVIILTLFVIATSYLEYLNVMNIQTSFYRTIKHHITLLVAQLAFTLGSITACLSPAHKFLVLQSLLPFFFFLRKINRGSDNGVVCLMYVSMKSYHVKYADLKWLI